MGKNLMLCRRSELAQYVVDSGIAKQLVDKMYEKRKAAALELEK